MKYLKLYSELNEEFDFINKLKIKYLCNKYNVKKWSMNTDGSIDIDGNVYLDSIGLDKFPFKFGNVTGYFNCSYNKLITLKGGPKETGGGFNCSYNKLITLEGSPESVGGDFSCRENKLESIVGCPRIIGGDLIVGYAYYANLGLSSLVGVPQEVGGYFTQDNNTLISLDGLPEITESKHQGRHKNNNIKTLDGFPINLGGEFHCFGNPVYELWRFFEDKDKVELFNDFGITDGEVVILDRLNEFLEMIGKPIVINTEELEKEGYKII